MLIVALTVLVAVLYYISFRRLRRPLYELSDKLPDIGGLPVIGHGHWFMGSPEKILSNLNTIGERIENLGGVGKVWLGPSLYIISLKPEDVQKILETCLQKDNSYKFLQTWLGNGLFVAPVDLWKLHRRLLLPIFNKHIVEDFLPVFAQQANLLVARLAEQSGPFDVYPFVTSCMLDIVFETAMGERMDVQRHPNTPYLRARTSVISIINKRLFKVWLQPDALFNLTSYAKELKEGIQLTHQFTDEVVKRKRMEMKEKNSSNTFNSASDEPKDLLSLLIERDNNMSDKQLREHIDSITIAGNDTTALVISYALLLLGCHPQHQEMAYQELQSIFGDSNRTPTKEDLNKMEYLERVIKETMRLYAVVPVIGRKTEKELQLSTCTVPAGVGLAVFSHFLHRSEKLWGKDVHEFHPDRFLPENSVSRHPCAYIPFSHGSRNCIGRHFGILAMKMILSVVLRNFKIKSKALDRLKIEVLLFPVDGHVLSVERR